MSGLVKKVFGRGGASAQAQQAAAGSQPLTGIDPAARGGPQRAPGDDEGRRRGRRGGQLGGGRGGLGAQTVLSRTY